MKLIRCEDGVYINAKYLVGINASSKDRITLYVGEQLNIIYKSNMSTDETRQECKTLIEFLRTEDKDEL